MKVFEVSFNGVKEGALVSLDNNLPAIVIGEEGRGREIGAVYVKGAAPKERVTNGKLTFVNHIPVLIANEPDDESSVMVVARTTMGFRGHGYIKGRHLGWKIQYDYIGVELSKKLYPTQQAADDAAMEERQRGVYVKKTVPVFEDYEPSIIAKGQVADGMAGNAGSAEQAIFLAFEGDIFSLYRTGRLYGDSPVIQFRVSSGKVEKYDEYFDMLKNFLEE